MDVQLRQMKRYLNPRLFSRDLISLIGGTLLIVVMISISILCFKAFLVEGVSDIEDIEAYGTIILFFCFVAFIFSIEGIIKRIRLGKQFRRLEQYGEMSKVLSDFEYARPMLDGKVMMGSDYAFGKKCGVIIAYADIDRVYEYVHYTNSIRDQRMIKVKLIDGKHYDLCHLKVFKKKFEEEMAIIQTILERNPSVQVGYEK